MPSPRIVEYNRVLLPYSSVTIDAATRNVGRHQIALVWDLSFRGVLVGKEDELSGNPSRKSFHAMKAELLAAHKRLVVTDSGSGNKPWIDVRPLTKGIDPFSSRNMATQYDIAGGPYPTSFRVLQTIGSSFQYQFDIRITTVGPDFLVFAKDNALIPILGLEASVTYGINVDHYTTRRITGTMHLGRVQGTDDNGFLIHDGLDGTLLDNEFLREILTGGESNRLLQRYLGIPDGMKRVDSEWSYSPDLQQLTFSFTDEEQYRTLPWEITSGDAVLRSTYQGIAFGAPLVQVLSGFFVAPKDVAKERIMARILELMAICNGYDDRIARFVDSMSIGVSLYRNRIDFEVRSLTAYGALPGVRKGSSNDPDAVLYAFGLGQSFGFKLDKLSNNNRSLSPRVFGTAGLAGHAYNTQLIGSGFRDRHLHTEGYNEIEYDSLRGKILESKSDEFEASLRDFVYNPGSVRFIYGRQEAIILRRDSIEGTTQARTVIVVGGSQLMVFCGYQVHQVQSTSEKGKTDEDDTDFNRILPRRVLNSLKNYGIFRSERSDGKRVAQAVPGANNEPIFEIRFFWWLTLHSEIKEAINSRYDTLTTDELSARINSALGISKVTLYNLSDFIAGLISGKKF